MIIDINVDELKQIAILLNDVAVKVENSNNAISTVISKHDWKCHERVSIDETLEQIKANSVVLTTTFEEFSAKIIQLANECTGFINDQIRNDAACEDEIASLMALLTCGRSSIKVVSGGDNFSRVNAELMGSSMNENNISSLHGALHGINIVDFSIYTEKT